MLAFSAKQKINLSWPHLRKKINCSHTCPKRTCYVAAPLFRNSRCPLWTSLTWSSKLIFTISQKFSNYLLIPGYFMHFIPAIIDITIFRQLDNKRFNFIMKYMVHETNFFFLIFFNHMIDIIYPIFSGDIFFTLIPDHF